MNPKRGFASIPITGKIVYIVPTTTVEKPNCLANVGIKGTTGAVPEIKLFQTFK